MLVGFGAQHLVAQLRNLLLVNLDLAFEFLAILLIGGQRGAIRLQLAQVRFKRLLDRCDVLRKRGHFLFKRGNLLV